jgi:hypothetical protein
MTTQELTSASLYAIGPFAPALMDCLEYPAERLTSLHAGTSVCVCVGEAFEEGVLELAELLGIDPWAPEHHFLDPHNIDAAALDRAGFATADVIERLRAAGFSFHFVLEPAWAAKLG